MIERFFRPFLGGIFLERELQTPTSMCHFVLRMFSSGTAALPAVGMGAIPAQLAAGLPTDWLQLNRRAVSVTPTEVVLDDGEKIMARAVVVATDGLAAAHLLNLECPHSRRVTCLHFAAPRDPVAEPILVLNGEGRGPVNNLCVPNQVCSGYAPAGSALVSATILGDADADTKKAVCRQLTEWYGNEVEDWRLLHQTFVAHALPVQVPFLPLDQAARTDPGIYVCGDHRATPSLQGAMVSGRQVADAIAADIQA